MNYNIINTVVRLMASYVFLKQSLLLGSWSSINGSMAFWVNPNLLSLYNEGSVWMAILGLLVPLLTIFWPRKVAWLLLLQAYATIYFYSPYVLNGSGKVMINLLFLACVTYYLPVALRAIRIHISPSTWIKAMTFAMQLQVVMVYLIAGVAKLFSDEWLSGAALKYMLLNRLFNVSAYNEWIATSPGLIQFGTYSFIFFELTFVSILILKRLRIWLHMAGITFHLGGYWLLGIEGFPEVMLASYLLFYSQEEINHTWMVIKRNGFLLVEAAFPGGHRLVRKIQSFLNMYSKDGVEHPE